MMAVRRVVALFYHLSPIAAVNREWLAHFGTSHSFFQSKRLGSRAQLTCSGLSIVYCRGRSLCASARWGNRQRLGSHRHVPDGTDIYGSYMGGLLYGGWGGEKCNSLPTSPVTWLLFKPSLYFWWVPKAPLIDVCGFWKIQIWAVQKSPERHVADTAEHLSQLLWIYLWIHVHIITSQVWSGDV